MRNVSIVTAIGLFALANTAAATEGNKTGTEAPAQSSSMRAYVDSNGKLRQATAEEREADARQDNANAKARAAKGHGVVFKTLPSGARRALDTEGQLMESVVVSKNPDGSLAYSYVSGNGQVVETPAPHAEEK